MQNNDWPNETGDPDCHSYCAYYLHGSGPQTYSYSNQVNNNGSSVNFNGDMARAIHDWSGQPYNSPWFYDCQCSSGQLMTVTVGPVGNGLCGQGTVTTAWQAYGATNDNHIVSSMAEYATDSGDPWFDGPPPDTFSGSYCDAQSTAYHEVGHAFGEGHSTYASDVMYYGGGDTAAIDADAQSMLNAIYGPYQGGNGSGGGTSCGSCQVVCTLNLCAPGCASPQGNVDCIVWA